MMKKKKSSLTEYEESLRRCITQRRSIIHIETDDYLTEESRLKCHFREEARDYENSNVNIWLPDTGKKRFFSGDVEGDNLCESLRSLPGLKDKFKSILVIRGLHFYYDMQSDSIAQITTLLYEFYTINERKNKKERSFIVIISPRFDIPMELRGCIYSITPPYPDEKDIENELGLSDITDPKLYYGKGFEPEGRPYKFAKQFFKERGKEVYEENKKNLINALKGLRIHEINRLLYYGPEPFLIRGFDIKSFEESKKRMVQDSGLLKVEDFQDKERYDEYVGDIEGLKRYMKKEKGVIDNRAFYNEKMPLPKGILLVGPPGCGKSETSKAIASILDMPLYSMDMGRLLGSLMGQSEHNFEKALSIAEAAQPCVLRIDEIEKAFAGSGADQSEQTMTHIVGHFLTWMQERKSLVYLVATANNLEQLRPEFLRKGRWDEIFYLTYPSADGMKRIIESCLKKYNLRMEDGDDNCFEKETDDLGNVIRKSPIGKTTEHIIEEFFKKYKPIKVSGAEIVDIIEQLYKSQFVSSPKSEESRILSVSIFETKLTELANKDRDIEINKIINRDILEIEIGQILKNRIDDKLFEERIKKAIELKYGDDEIKSMIASELDSLEINSLLAGNRSKFNRKEVEPLLGKKYNKCKLIHEELLEIKLNLLLHEEKHVKECEKELRAKLREKYQDYNIEEYFESKGYKSASQWPPIDN